MSDQHEEEVVDAEVVADPRDASQAPSSALAPVSRSNVPAVGQGEGVVTLWNTHDPTAIVDQASKVASALANVIEKQDLAKNLGGRKKHVEIEGWQIAGTFLGAQAIVTDTRRVQPRTEFPVNSKRKKWGNVNGKRQIVEETEHNWLCVGWSFDAVAEVHTMDGRVIGRGEATCSREEPNWMEATDSAVKGMAQTRACSRALRQALGFIVGLAGYSGTPQEEMDAAGLDHRIEMELADDRQTERFMAALGWLLPPGELEKTVEGIRKRFDGQLYGPVAEAIAFTIGARKLFEEAEAKEAEQEARQADAADKNGDQPMPGDGDPDATDQPELGDQEQEQEEASPEASEQPEESDEEREEREQLEREIDEGLDRRDAEAEAEAEQAAEEEGNAEDPDATGEDIEPELPEA